MDYVNDHHIQEANGMFSKKEPNFFLKTIRHVLFNSEKTIKNDRKKYIFQDFFRTYEILERNQEMDIEMYGHAIIRLACSRRLLVL